MTVLKGGEGLIFNKRLMICIIFITNEPPIHDSMLCFSVLFKHASIINLPCSAIFSVFFYCRLIIKNEHYDMRIGLVLPDGLQKLYIVSDLHNTALNPTPVNSCYTCTDKQLNVRTSPLPRSLVRGRTLFITTNIQYSVTFVYDGMKLSKHNCSKRKWATCAIFIMVQ